MTRLILLGFLVFYPVSISSASVSPNTFVFDFDSTITSLKTGLNQHTISKICERSSNSCQELKDVRLAIKKEGVEGIKISSLLWERSGIRPTISEIDDTVKDASNNLTPRMIDLIRSLIEDGHLVYILGGGTYGCYMIPQAIKGAVKKNMIMSGAMKSKSKKDIWNAPNYGSYYSNCSSGKNYSDVKSNAIKILRSEKKTIGKVVMIGDGENDLEALTGGGADYFIGYGEHNVNEKVQEKANYFVKNTKELSNSIKIINDLN